MSSTSLSASCSILDGGLFYAFRKFNRIRVSSGDTLWDIAKEYRTEEYSDISSYIAEVREINHLSSNQITDGMYLCIPYYSEEYKS